MDGSIRTFTDGGGVASAGGEASGTMAPLAEVAAASPTSGGSAKAIGTGAGTAAPASVSGRPATPATGVSASSKTSLALGESGAPKKTTTLSSSSASQVVMRGLAGRGAGAARKNSSARTRGRDSTAARGRGGTARRLALGSDARCRSMASARPPWVTSWAQATAAEEGLHPVWNDGDGLVEAAGARGSLGPARESLDPFDGVGSLPDGSLEPCGSSH